MQAGPFPGKPDLFPCRSPGIFAPMTPTERRALQGIAVGGLIAGTLDISYACIATWILAAKPPAYVLQSVASGIMGQPAYEGGTPVAAFGLLLHFFIATTWTLVFYVASRRLRFL